MASYTTSQLKDGTPTEALYGGQTFTLTNNSTGSVYFIIETVANSTGSFSSKPTNAIGIYDQFVSIDEESFFTSSYVTSVVVPMGESSFRFKPYVDVEESSSLLRGTGEISLVIT